MPLRVRSLRLADQSGQQHGLSAGDRDRACHPALRHGRGQRAGVGVVGDRADFLLDVQQHVAVGVDAGATRKIMPVLR